MQKFKHIYENIFAQLESMLYLDTSQITACHSQGAQITGSSKTYFCEEKQKWVSVFKSVDATDQVGEGVKGS